MSAKDLVKQVVAAVDDPHGRQREVDRLRARVAAVDAVLDRIVAEYYTGCKAYVAAGWPDDPDNATRVFWRLRLPVLSQVGSELADALRVAEPDWEFMREQAEEGTDR